MVGVQVVTCVRCVRSVQAVARLSRMAQNAAAAIKTAGVDGPLRSTCMAPLPLTQGPPCNFTVSVAPMRAVAAGGP